MSTTVASIYLVPTSESALFVPNVGGKPNQQKRFSFPRCAYVEKTITDHEVHSYLMLVASYSPATYSNYTTATSLFWCSASFVIVAANKSSDLLSECFVSLILHIIQYGSTV